MYFLKHKLAQYCSKLVLCCCQNCWWISKVKPSQQTRPGLTCTKWGRAPPPLSSYPHLGRALQYWIQSRFLHRSFIRLFKPEPKKPNQLIEFWGAQWEWMTGLWGGSAARWPGTPPTACYQSKVSPLQGSSDVISNGWPDRRHCASSQLVTVPTYCLHYLYLPSVQPTFLSLLRGHSYRKLSYLQPYQVGSLSDSLTTKTNIPSFEPLCLEEILIKFPSGPETQTGDVGFRDGSAGRNGGRK